MLTWPKGSPSSGNASLSIAGSALRADAQAWHTRR